MNTNETELLTLRSEIEKKALGPEDTFDFSCDRCGRCCRGRAYIYPKDKLVYFCQDVSCGAKTEAHTVREWLAEFGREYEDSDTLAWMKLTPRLSLWMHKHEPSLSETKKQALWAQMLRLCYLQYDIRQPFTPQFAANTAALLGQMAGA